MAIRVLCLVFRRRYTPSAVRAGSTTHGPLHKAFPCSPASQPQSAYCHERLHRHMGFRLRRPAKALNRKWSVATFSLFIKSCGAAWHRAQADIHQPPANQRTVETAEQHALQHSLVLRGRASQDLRRPSVGSFTLAKNVRQHGNTKISPLEWVMSFGVGNIRIQSSSARLQSNSTGRKAEPFHIAYRALCPRSSRGYAGHSTASNRATGSLSTRACTRRKFLVGLVLGPHA